MPLQDRWKESEHFVQGSAYHIRMCRPEKMNALTPTLYGEIRAGVLAGIGLPDVRCVVIEGSSSVFATGGDLQIFKDMLQLPPDERMVVFNESFDTPLPFQTILDCPKPVIAQIDGWCLAGGAILAAAADISIATGGSTFGVPEGRVGLADPFAATLLPAAIGLGRARYLMLTGARIDAATAERWGLILRSVPTERLEEEVSGLVDLIGGLAPEAQRGYKRAAVRYLPRMTALEIMEVALTANGAEGLAAFGEKRPPVFGPSHYPV